jgi:DNA modification methylase
LNIKNINVNNLNPAKYNPRKHLKPGDVEFEKIKKSIETFGYVEPIVVNEVNNVVIGGNQRLKVLKDLGYENIKCVMTNCTEEEEKALNVALNKIDGVWDEEKLKELFVELKDLDFDTSFTGFNDDEINNLIESFDNEAENDSDDFDVKEAIEEIEIKGAKTKRGNIYQLGKHFLMCGDSFDLKNRQLLITESFDMIFTDPPYDMDGCSQFRSMENVKSRIKDMINFDVNKLSFLRDLDIKSYYIFTSKNGIKKYFSIFDDYQFNILVWCKTNPVPLCNNNFLPDMEYLMYFYKDKRIWNNQLKPTKVYKKYYISKKEAGRNKDGNLHPTMKPFELLLNRIRISSKSGGNVLDLFGGSGTTLIACEQLNRKCYMMELLPEYCDIIINRYINYKKSSDDVFLIDGNKKISWANILKVR